jgi:peptidoglycan/xylan/chitin deacetylase (PgdA/CDA1 family)
MRSIKILILLLLIILTACDTVSYRQRETYVCLTFDDQHSSVYHTAYPLLEEHDLKGTLFVNTERLGREHTLSWAQIETMVTASAWEVGGHTLHHVNLPDLSYEEAYEEIYLDYLNLVEQGFTPRSFALPSGHATEENLQIIAEFYANIRTSMNLSHYIPVNRRYLGYLPFQTGDGPDVLIGRIIAAIQNEEDLVILGFHSFNTAEGDEISYCDPLIFQEIIEFISDNDLTVLTINEACELLGAN